MNSRQQVDPQDRKCHCNLLASNTWYLTGQTTNKCNSEMMGYAAQSTEILRTRTVCLAEAGSGSGSRTGVELELLPFLDRVVLL